MFLLVNDKNKYLHWAGSNHILYVIDKYLDCTLSIKSYLSQFPLKIC